MLRTSETFEDRRHEELIFGILKDQPKPIACILPVCSCRLRCHPGWRHRSSGLMGKIRSVINSVPALVDRKRGHRL